MVNKEDTTMKSILKFSALALLASALMASCAKETDMPVEGKKITKTFTCSFAQPDTKLGVTDAGKTTWEVGDEIMIHGGKDGAVQQLVKLTAEDISADGKKAKITVVDMEPYDRTDAGVVSKFYAQYPASLVPTGNMYYECRFTATNDFLMAACNVEDEFVFFNLCGIISYTVNGDFDKVVFCGNNGEVVGYSTVYQVRVRDDGQGPKVNYNKPGNESGDPVPMKNFEAELKPGATNYVFLPAGAKFTDGFTFKFYDGAELKKVAKTSKSVNVDHGMLLALGDITAHLEDYVPPTSSDHKSAITNATDLYSFKANSFVITAPGAYKFPALKGESDEEVGNVFDVELLWETYNNAETVTLNSVIAAVDFEDNWIYFKTPETLKPGNAVIAAKDVDGKIIWSWHIWIPETALADVDASNIYGGIVMDRNLGALRVTETGSGVVASVESFGLMYQWGRKDPFPGPKRVDSNTLALIAGTPFVLKDQTHEEYVSGDLVNGTMTVTEAIQNPTVFGNKGGGHWDENVGTSLWKEGEKTIYDPCPAGYRVMDRDRNHPLWNTDNIATALTNAGMTWESSLDGHWVKITDGANVMTIPLAGYIDDCDVKNVPYIEYPGKRAAVYCAYYGPYHLNIREDKTDYHKAGSTSAARGASVRCIKIDGWVAPEHETTEPEHDPMKAEWLFTADACQVEGSYGYTFSSGTKMFKDDNTFNGFEAVASKEAGDGGLYVLSNVTEGGKLTFVQVDKTELDKEDKAARTVGSTGHPFVTGVWQGDYWLFEASDGYTYKAGTKVHIKFVTRVSGTGMKYWMLEYWDGLAWQPAYEPKSVTSGDETIQYNFTPTSETSNSTVSVTWTLAADCAKQMFRYVCAGKEGLDGALPEAPWGGTCRIAGAANTSPVFEVLDEKGPETLEDGSTRVTIDLLAYAAEQRWQNGNSYSTVVKDGITMTASWVGDNANGYYYDTDWRFYQARKGGLTIAAPEGHELVKATFTYTVSKNGVLLDPAGNQLPSGTECALSGQSALFTVGNTGTANNGQARISKIVVDYK